MTSWTELAAELGTTRKSLQRWREEFRGECPATPDVDRWRPFMRERGLGHYSGRRNAPPAPAPPPGSQHARGPEDPRGAPVIDAPWECRRAVLFELGEFLHSSFKAGELTAAEYRVAGEKTAELICELGRAWNAEIDEAGYASRWYEIAAELHEPAPAANHADG